MVVCFQPGSVIQIKGQSRWRMDLIRDVVLPHEYEVAREWLKELRYYVAK